MHVIYKINFSSGKVYVGQTNNFIARRNQHLSEARKGEDFKVYRAMRKYNTTKDDFEIIEENIDNQELANDREIYWIAYYDSYHNGYNSTPGGECGSHKIGEDSPLAKLKNSDVITIRKIRATMKYQKSEIYEFYKNKISESTFGKIWTYQTWKEIVPELNTPELKEFYRKFRKNAKGEKNAKSHFSNEEVYELRVLFYVKGTQFKDLYKERGKGVCRTSFQRLLYGQNYKEVPMPEKSYEWRKANKHPYPEEIKKLREDFSNGKTIKELQSGFFENYSKKAIENIINYKTYTDI